MILLLIAIGGCIGAVSRFFISSKLNKSLPFGTFLINVIGSFLLGYFINLGLSKQFLAFLGSGFCGAFTTFSTFKLEAFQMIIEHRSYTSLFYIVLSYTLGILFAYAGFLVGKM